MATHVLFQSSKTWSLSHLPSPFNRVDGKSNDLKTRFSMDDVVDPAFKSMFEDITPNSKTINTNSMLLWALLLESRDLCPVNELKNFSLMEISCTDDLLWYAAEYDAPDGSTIVVDYQVNRSDKISSTLRGARISAGSNTFSALTAPSQNKDFSYPIEVVYLPIIEAMKKYNAFFAETAEKMWDLVRDMLMTDTITTDDLLKLAEYSHLFYGMIDQDTLKASASVKRLPVKFVAGNMKILSAKELSAGPYADGQVIYGQASYLRGMATSVAAKAIQKNTVANIKKEFEAFNSQFHWTEEERLFIPQFKDDMIVPDETLEIARSYVASRDMDVPMVNFLWRGKTSYGKTTGVELLACILDRPLLRQTCHPGMETQDFLSAFVPDNGSSYLGAIPTVEEMYCDPESAYESITGFAKEDVTAQECLEELLKRSAKANGGARFKHVEANYVKALKNGYIIELSEVSRIREPGVLVGLDDYDKPGAVVPLVDGGYVRRHRDAVVVMTDNVGYVSCRPVDPAVLRRMAFVLDTDTMPKAKVIARVKANTGFDDKGLLDIMYNTWKELSDYCESHEINEGPISLTELERWVRATCSTTSLKR